MSTIQEITSEEEWRAHVASLSKKTLLVISFHAPWAAPCTQMNAVLKALAAEYPVSADHPTSWVSLNAEELSDISETYDVTAVPFLVLQRDDQILETVSGSSAVKVRAAIEAHVKPSASSSSTSASTTQTPASTADTATSTTTTAHSTANGAADSTQPQVDAPAADPALAKEELWKKLGELVKAAPVMLFMKGTPSGPQCGFSRQLVALLRERSVKYGFFNILADDEVRQGLKEFADWPTYPQLWMDGELVGGLDIIKEELENDADFFKAHSITKEETTTTA